MGRLIALYVAFVFLIGGAFSWLIVELLGPREGPQPTEAFAETVTVAQATVPEPPAVDGLAPSPLPLSLPIDCDPGRDCWIVNYVDRDPGKGFRDYACGDMGYDGHKGTDIAIAHAGRLEENVPVLAAASGSVVGVRDGMADVFNRGASRDDLDGKDCGNGVRIDHGGGWATQYCHLKKGSVSVKVGDTVVAGDRLGSVGLSGATQFPHIHMTVNKDKAVIDPFAGLDGAADNCGLGRAPLWEKPVLRQLAYYSPFAPNAGFADHVPEAKDAKSGKLGGWAPLADSPALVFWTELYGTRAGDRLELMLVGPDGEKIADKTETLDRNRNWLYRAIGRKVRGNWAPGTYVGTVSVTRPNGPGQRQFEQSFTTTLR